MNVLIYSRNEIEEIIDSGKFLENTAVISFYDPKIKRIDRNYSHSDYRGVCENVFYSELDDLDLDCMKEKGYTYNTYFPEADEIAEFVYNVYNNGMDIICQCEYGQSKSVRTAVAILEHFFKSGIWGQTTNIIRISWYSIKFLTHSKNTEKNNFHKFSENY
ncbi:MAG: hypothetical protein K2I80_12245 [Ruminococcus sp.]|nr:hypothetical protein [Ruminococcus sp.]